MLIWSGSKEGIVGGGHHHLSDLHEVLKEASTMAEHDHTCGLALCEGVSFGVD